LQGDDKGVKGLAEEVAEKQAEVQKVSPKPSILSPREPGRGLEGEPQYLNPKPSIIHPYTPNPCL
jgi:hypothetical protein